MCIGTILNVSDQQAQFSYEYDHLGTAFIGTHNTHNGVDFVPRIRQTVFPTINSETC